MQCLVPWFLAMASSVSCSCQNSSLSPYSEKDGCDWFLRDERSASTQATRELVGSRGVRPRLNFPVRSPLGRKTSFVKEQLRTCLKRYPRTYPFSGLHGNMATPSLLHTSRSSHSVERQSKLYCALKWEEIKLNPGTEWNRNK